MKQFNTLFWALHKGLIDGVGGKHCAHGDYAIGEAFGGGDQVWGNTKALGGKRCAYSTKGGDHFIKN